MCDEISADFPNFQGIWPNYPKIKINRLFLPDIFDISSFICNISKKSFPPEKP
jgi:hypothetical protein